MKRAYPYLHAKLKEYHIDQAYLAEKLERSQPYVSERLNAKPDRFWSQKDMYTIMEMVQERPENLHLLFPRNGVQLESKSRTQEAVLKLDLIEAIVLHGDADKGKNARSSKQPASVY